MIALFRRSFAQIKPFHPIIAPHPRIRAIRITRAFLAVNVISILIIITVPMFIEKIVYGKIVSSLYTLPFLLLIALYVYNICFSFVIEHRWKRINTLRITAVQGDVRLLADKQPELNADGWRFPVKIAVRLARGILIVWSLIVIVVTNISTFLLLNRLKHFDWFLFLTVIIIVDVVIASLLVLMWYNSWIIEVRQEGIQSPMEASGANKSINSLIPWHEARLFCCYTRPSIWKKRAAMIYELSSNSQVVMWTWVQNNEPGRIRLVPTESFEEHHRQMQALCELIRARTGLPLYDLSKGQRG